MPNSKWTLIVLATALCLGIAPQRMQAQSSTVALSSALSAVRVFPNPWRVDQHRDVLIKFDHLPDGATVELFTLSGEYLATLTSSANETTWNRTNRKGERVASGIYLYVVKDPQGNTTTGKLAIIY